MGEFCMGLHTEERETEKQETKKPGFDTLASRWLGGIAIALAMTCAPVHGFAQETKTTLALPPAPLLPKTLGKLTRTAEGDAGDGLDAVDANDKAVLTEDGLRRFARSEYKGDGPQKGTVTVYKFVDASGAVAAFDYFRKPELRVDQKLGDAASFDRQGRVFLSGLNVVRENINLGGDELMQELITHLPKATGTTGIMPLLPTMVPQKGLAVGGARYALGPAGYQANGGTLPANLLGFDKAGEAVTAKYNGKGTLTLLIYPTPQIAGEHGRAIEAELRKPGGADGTVMLRREGPLVLVTTGAWNAVDAKALIEGIHLRSEITWDKKMPLEFHTEVQKTYSLLQSIALFCVLGALAAVVLGLFFGGGRAAIRVLQGKPAASEPEFLRIDLHGKSAPIHTDSPSS
jgi:hypothetical protein